MQQSSAQRWVLEHSLEIEAWLDDMTNSRIIDLEDYPHYFQLLYNNADITYQIIEDFYLSDKEKIGIVVSSILSSDYVVSVVYGDPGQGKTSFNYQLLHYLHQQSPSTPIYVLGTWKKPPFASKILFDLNDIPSNSFAYIAELAKYFPARESSSQDNRTLSSQLLDLRHFNIKLFGETQKASSCDINIPRYANFKFFKYMDPQNIRFEREQIMNLLIEMLIPKDSDNKKLTLGICNNRYFTFNMELPSFYSVDFSKNLSSVTEEDKLDYAKSLFRRGYSPSDVQQRLTVHFRYNQSLDFWKNLSKSL